MEELVKYVLLTVAILIIFCLGLLLYYILPWCKKEVLDNSTPEKFCKSLIAGFKVKAKHNKQESMFFFMLTMLGSLAAPLFVTLGGDDFILTKVIPSILSALVAFGTAWLQLRKPQHLWALYRGCQRKLEDNLYRYKFKVGDYAGGDVNVLLAERCADIAMEAHNEWLPIMPRGENLGQARAKEE
ncbi:TPA: DUF4231 domain-containing protein [Pseudomonas putida]|nr:DUF4231 domain-containing protein [Pseudomonas putida]